MTGCKNCGWAEWQRIPTGRIKKQSYGRCRVGAPEIAVPIPACFEITIHRRNVIWPDEGEGCPTWKEMTPSC